MADPIDIDEALNLVSRLWPRGVLARIPKRPRERDLVLGLVCSRLQRRVAYTEQELGGVIEEALSAFRCPTDHVTVRRSLVDYGFVKRDVAGSNYFLYYPRLEEAINEDVVDQGFTLIEAQIERTQARAAERRRRRGQG